MGARRAIAVASSLAASAARLGAGLSVRLPLGPRPRELLELWEFEACPYARRVREALSELDLDARIHPCPRGGSRFLPALRARGRDIVPVLRDPDRGVELDDSAEIVHYLFEQYGGGRVGARLRGPLAVATSALAS